MPGLMTTMATPRSHHCHRGHDGSGVDNEVAKTAT